MYFEFLGGFTVSMNKPPINGEITKFKLSMHAYFFRRFSCLDSCFFT